ncbi:hypothetical protein T484DRAFT_1940883 [Baffinella frigidus]|nr:hypothetical protein T484DRAFT_1940883 [Cryptophyta sp. CCMP2293]
MLRSPLPSGSQPLHPPQASAQRGHATPPRHAGCLAQLLHFDQSPPLLARAGEPLAAS